MKATFKNFEVKTSYKGNKEAGFIKGNFNNHMVKVTNTETKESITFEFWCSIASPEFETEYDVLNAFYTFVSDATISDDSFEWFCSNYGYDTDSRSAEKIYKACKKSLLKLRKIYDGDVYDLANELGEKYA